MAFHPPPSKLEGLQDDLLTLEEVVAWLRVPRSWVYERTRKGQIPHLKLGKYLRFPRHALTAWLATHSGLGSPPGSLEERLEGSVTPQQIRRFKAPLGRQPKGQ